jgi:hypothetical protein
MTVQLTLSVNRKPINTDYFVAGFIDHVVSGMIEALEDTGKIKDLALSIEGNKVVITLNGSDVPINAFVSKIFKGTLTGMISTLKGVGQIEKLGIILNK